MLYPMFTYVLFIYLFVIVNFIFRVRAVRAKEVRLSYFQLFRAGEHVIPPHIQAGTNHMANMFETPVLFFVVSVLAIVLGIETVLLQILAWSYVAVRVVHAWIHSTYNDILHRLVVFWVSLLLLLAMWLHVVISAA